MGCPGLGRERVCVCVYGGTRGFRRCRRPGVGRTARMLSFRGCLDKKGTGRESHLGRRVNATAEMGGRGIPTSPQPTRPPPISPHPAPCHRGPHGAAAPRVGRPTAAPRRQHQPLTSAAELHRGASTQGALLGPPAP